MFGDEEDDLNDLQDGCHSQSDRGRMKDQVKGQADQDDDDGEHQHGRKSRADDHADRFRNIDQGDCQQGPQAGQKLIRRGNGKDHGHGVKSSCQKEEGCDGSKGAGQIYIAEDAEDDRE